MEKHLGHSLPKGSIIHHIDGNKLNNSIDNLLLLVNDEEHRKIHIQLEKLSLLLVQQGIITFDLQTKTYIVADTKLRELLEPLEEDNQQPRRIRKKAKGSETRSNLPVEEDEGPRARSTQFYLSDDIVRTVDITNETTEPEDKELLG